MLGLSNDENVRGGLLWDVTVGLNWYMSANSRVMLNYVMSDLEDAGTSALFMTRFQIVF